MKEIKFIFLLLICNLFFINCVNKNKKNIPYIPFNIKNLKNISIKSFEDKNLNSQEYFREVADVVIFNKKVNDTITQLAFDNLGKVTHKIWYITLNNSNSSNTVNDILYNHNVLALHNFSNCEKNESQSSFPVIDDSNNVFLCNVYMEENKNYLKITYHFNSNGAN